MAGWGQPLRSAAQLAREFKQDVERVWHVRGWPWCCIPDTQPDQNEQQLCRMVAQLPFSITSGVCSTAPTSSSDS